MAQGSPLGPAIVANNLLALVLEKASEGRGDVAYADTGEPAKATTTTTTAAVFQANFSLNGVGNQPPVSQGAYGLLITALSTATVIASIVIEAVDTTATTGGHVECVDVIPAPAAGDSMSILRTFAASLAAGADAIAGLTNVVGLRLTIALTTTGGGVNVQFAAAGTP